MNYLESIGHIKEFLQTIKTFFTGKVLGFLFLASSALIFLEKFFFLPIIIYPMDKIISWILLLSAIGISYKVYSCFWNKITNYIDKQMKQREVIAEQLRQDQREEQLKQDRDLAIKNLFGSLSYEEISILKYVVSNNGFAWLPAENILVLSLLSKRCLRVLNRISTLRGVNYLDSAQCVPCELPYIMRDYINRNMTEVNSSWEHILVKKDFEIYQED